MQDVARDLGRPFQFLLRDDEGRHIAQDVGARGHGQQALFIALVHDGRDVNVHLHAGDQAAAPNLGDVGRIQFGQQIAQVIALGPDRSQELGLGNAIQDGAGHVGGQRAAGEGGGVIAGVDHVGHLLVHADGADGQAARQRLGQGHDVGGNLVAHNRLVAPQRARAAHAALHLVEDQHGVVLVGQFPQALEELGRGHVDAALALDRLHDDGAHALVHEFAGTVQVVVEGEADAGHQRLEGILVLGPRRGRQTAEQAPVKAVGEGQDVVLLLVVLVVGVAPGELEGAFVGIRAGQAVVDLVGKAVFAQLLRQPGMGRRVVQIAHVVDPALHHLHDGGLHVRIAVAEGVDGDAGDTVQVALAVGVGQRGALAGGEDHGRAAIDAQHVLLFQVNNLLCVQDGFPLVVGTVWIERFEEVSCRAASGCSFARSGRRRAGRP